VTCSPGAALVKRSHSKRVCEDSLRKMKAPGKGHQYKAPTRNQDVEFPSHAPATSEGILIPVLLVSRFPPFTVL